MKSGNDSSFSWVLTISLVGLAVLCIQYYFKTKEQRGFQAAVAMYQNKNAQLQSLGTDLREYSRTHPQIVPLLESVGIIQSPKANSPAANTAKPSTK